MSRPGIAASSVSWWARGDAAIQVAGFAVPVYPVGGSLCDKDGSVGPVVHFPLVLLGRDIQCSKATAKSISIQSWIIITQIYSYTQPNNLHTTNPYERLLQCGNQNPTKT